MHSSARHWRKVNLPLHLKTPRPQALRLGNAPSEKAPCHERYDRKHDDRRCHQEISQRAHPALHQLPHRPAFLCVGRQADLPGLAVGDSGDRPAVALSARAVLHHAVLVLRLQHQRHAPPRTDRALRPDPGAGDHPRRHARWQPPRRTYPFWRRYANHRRPRPVSSPNDGLRDQFDIEPNAEIAIEVDPRRLDRAMANALGQSGVTRASLGVQTFDPAVQKAVARVQSVGVTSRCADLLRDAGIAGNQRRPAVRPAARDRGHLRSQRRSRADPATGSVFRIRLCPRADNAEAPAGDRCRMRCRTRANACARNRRSAMPWSWRAIMRIGLDHYAHPGDTLAQAAWRAGCGETSRATPTIPPMP